MTTLEPTPKLHRTAPPTDTELRSAIYAGHVFHMEATEASLRLCAAVRELLEEALETSDLPRVQFAMSADEFFSRIGSVRKRLGEEELFDALMEQLLSGLGFDTGEWVHDALRMRAVTHEGHENHRAHAAYTAHRDTWYANSRAQLNWWLPILDVVPEQTFSIYPAYFSRGIRNSSGDFDYSEWIASVGWQNYSAVSAEKKKPVYPEPLEPFEKEPAWRLAMRTGEILVFSASHLHQTYPNTSGTTRFSLDFRTVRLTDHEAGLGAPDPDNRSTGSAMAEYRPFRGASR